MRIPAVGTLLLLLLLQAHLESPLPFANFTIGSSLRSDERKQIESQWIFLRRVSLGFSRFRRVPNVSDVTTFQLFLTIGYDPALIEDINILSLASCIIFRILKIYITETCCESNW